HVWSDDNKFRFIATDMNEVKEVSAYFEKIIDAREQMNENDILDAKPYYIIFSMSKALSTRSEMMKKILSSKTNLHISVVTFYDELKNLPKECSMVVELGDTAGRLFDKNDITGKSTRFTPDIY